jgi:hypothetical protein
MNEFAIGIEIANRGTGEPYPTIQQETVKLINALLCINYGIPVGNCRGHFEWTDRKIDPSGPSQWAPGGGKWNMDQFRSDVFWKVAELTQPIVTPGDDMNYFDDPLRIFDSRNPFWNSTGFEPGVHTMPLTSFPQIPDSATVIALTVTAADAKGDGYVTLSSGKNAATPVGSHLNYKPSTAPIANTTAVKLFNKGFKLYVHTKTHLIFDVIGWQ